MGVEVNCQQVKFSQELNLPLQDLTLTKMEESEFGIGKLLSLQLKHQDFQEPCHKLNSRALPFIEDQFVIFRARAVENQVQKIMN